MTQYTRADVDMADRHIAQGELQVAAQEIMLTKLIVRGLPVIDATALLALLNSGQVQHRAHRAAMLEAMDQNAPATRWFGQAC